MACAYICYLWLCIGTALAVLYNGEAPRQNAETVIGGLQQQQQPEPLTLPGYDYSVPAATAQQAFTGYSYTAPAVTAAEITTTTTTVRPPTTAAPTQPAAIGYIYNKPLAESYSPHTFFHAPLYQPSRQTPALTESSDANGREQLPLGTAPNNYLPQAEVDNSGKRFETVKPNVFVPHLVAAAVEVPQTLTQTMQAAKEQRNEDAALPGGYKYPRPASDAKFTAGTPDSYQQAFQQFADYLIWQRAHSKQQEQSQISTQTDEKQQQHTIPYAKQDYESQALPQINFPNAHTQYGAAIVPSGSFIQATPPAAAVPASTVATQQTTNLLALAPAPTSVDRRPVSSGELLSGERFISKDNTVEYYMEMPSESFELPTYSTMEMIPSQELSSSHDQSASQSYTKGNAEKLAQHSMEQVFHNVAAQANAPNFYEPTKQFSQTTQDPLRLQQQWHTPAPQAYVIQEQSHAAATQQKASMAKPPQQNQPLLSDARFAPTFAQLPTDTKKTQTPQPNDAWFAEIPQWPQNAALQQTQQQPLYNRVVKPVLQIAHELAQSQSNPQQQQQQWEKQIYYQKAQSQPHSQPQSDTSTAAAANSASIWEHNTQRFPRPTQTTQPTTPTTNTNAFINFNSIQFRRPHSTYGVPLDNNKAGGYNYQRPVGQ